MNKTLKIALSKLRPYGNHQWIALLSYAEIIALHENGYKGCKYDLANAQMQMKLGLNDCMWAHWHTVGKNKPNFNRVNKTH